MTVFGISPLNKIQKVGLRYCFVCSVLPFLTCSELLLRLGDGFTKYPLLILYYFDYCFSFTLKSPSGNSNMCMFDLWGMSSTTSHIFFDSFDYFHSSSDFFLSSNMLCFVFISTLV